MLRVLEISDRLASGLQTGAAAEPQYRSIKSPALSEAADKYHFGRITIQMHAFGNAPPQSPSAPAPPEGEPRNLLPPPGEVPRSGQGGVLGGGATCSAFTAKLKCIKKHNYSVFFYSSAASPIVGQPFSKGPCNKPAQKREEPQVPPLLWPARRRQISYVSSCDGRSAYP